MNNSDTSTIVRYGPAVACSTGALPYIDTSSKAVVGDNVDYFEKSTNAGLWATILER